jgi:iron-sulfur cluster insertion protein
MIQLTESARQRIREILAEENEPGLRVRAFVQGGGCQGLQYGFTLDQAYDPEQDFEIDDVVVDTMSLQYLTGAEIDWRDDDQGSSFVIRNPQAQTTCGCGNSFGPI